MTDARSPAAELLASCDARGIRLLVADNGGLAIDAPGDALAPDLLVQLRAHKAALLAVLQSPPKLAPGRGSATIDARANPTKPVCRCGSTRWRDAPIHGGQSVRRDCERCRRFIGFPVWHGK